MTVRRNVDVIMKEIKVLICSARENVSEYFFEILNSRDIKVTEIARNYTDADAVIKKNAAGHRLDRCPKGQRL